MRGFLRVGLVAVWFAGIAVPAPAQLITVRTIPVVRADELDPFPSHNMGMGGVSLALRDTLFDAALNPAKGVRFAGARFFSAPVAYNVSQGTGGGRALPMGAVAAAGPWFGGFSIALQMVDAARPTPSPFFIGLAREGATIRSTTLLADTSESHGNAVAFAMLGRSWAARGLSLGGSASFARRTAIDGVDLQYAGSRAVEQFGHAAEFRMGVLKEWPGSESLDILVLHSRSRMTHDVYFLDPFWDPGTQETFLRARSEHNRDEARTWGLHLAYERPLGEAGWRIGWLATANRVLQPAVPGYTLTGEGVLGVPWDPGNASAFNLGVGVGRTVASARFGLDLIYEPIRSATWQTADAETTTRLGATIPAGGKTLENDFRFANVLLRMGVGDEVEVASQTAVGFQLGLAVRRMQYWLAQYDNVQMAGRMDDEAWVEWTPAWGMSLRFPSWSVRYQGRAVQGTKRPGVFAQNLNRLDGDCCIELAVARSIVLPPGPAGMGRVTVATHQVFLSVPLGRPAMRGGTR